jgi:beta-galactosidase/beta-glucuronidase
LQSWWPDGEYTAPTDDALKFDLLAVKQFGLNAVRLHQNVNSDRWYYYADSLGVVILQDMIQKYGGATPATVPIFMTELKAMLDGLYNHPSIIQVSCTVLASLVLACLLAC